VNRREFITLLGGAAAGWPLAARAQQSVRVRRVGVLMPYAENDRDTPPRVMGLRQALQQLGWTQGHNVRLDHRWSASDADSTRKFARELVDLGPDVILTDTTPVTAAVLLSLRRGATLRVRS
jgi:putative tryptophan/tyrosine transport system substrate-binding protein